MKEWIDDQEGIITDRSYINSREVAFAAGSNSIQYNNKYQVELQVNGNVIVTFPLVVMAELDTALGG